MPEKKPKPIWGIDRNNLDAECVLLPEQVARYAEQMPDARMALDKAEANLKLVAADLDAEIRKDPKEFGLDKITEAAIKTTIPGTTKYRKAEQAIRKAKHELDVLQAALDVLRTKKASLEFLVQLHGYNYFSTPDTRTIASSR